eukprot:7722437-Alexandrium_andersonii.AAC.1
MCYGRSWRGGSARLSSYSPHVRASGIRASPTPLRPRRFEPCLRLRCLQASAGAVALSPRRPASSPWLIARESGSRPGLAAKGDQA